MNKLPAVNALRAFLLSHVKSERGATAVEYALLVGLIAAVIVVVVALIGTNLSGMFGKVSTDIN